MTAVAYCRISADKTGAGLGVERQAADCRNLALKLGLGEPKVLTDNDLSAYSRKRRPGYEQLKEGLREGRWDTLLLWHTDRLCRSLRDLEDIVDLVNGKVAVHCVKGGEIDLTTPEGRLQARMLGTLARYESEHRSDRVRRKLVDNAEKGVHHGGPRPYGWRCVADGHDHSENTRDRKKQNGGQCALVVDPAEAAIVAELTTRVINDESLRALAADLRKREVPSVSGVPWSPNSVRNTLIRARNAGLVEHRGQLMDHPGDWPAIVDRDLWDTAHALLTDPARRTSPGNAPRYLLSGLMTCGAPGCGEPVRAGGSRGGIPVYRCSTGGHVKRRVKLVDEVVEKYVLGKLEEGGVPYTPVATVSPDVRGLADGVRLRLEQLEDKYADGDLSRAGYLRNRDRLTAKLTELERDEVLARVPGPLEGVTPDNWSDLPLDRRRAVVAYLVEVTLLPAHSPHFDPELVKITKRPH